MLRRTLQTDWLAMPFAQRLQSLRKNRGLTQKQLAEQIDLSVLQIRRYESARAQPTLEVIKRLAVVLSVSADELIFDPEERQPSPDLLLEFEAISSFSVREKEMVKGVLKGLILKHQADQWGDARPAS